jgi:hypothetical protein
MKVTGSCRNETEQCRYSVSVLRKAFEFYTKCLHPTHKTGDIFLYNDFGELNNCCKI